MKKCLNSSQAITAIPTAKGVQLTCLTRPRRYPLSALCPLLLASGYFNTWMLAVLTISLILKAAFLIIYTKGSSSGYQSSRSSCCKKPAAEQERVCSPPGNPRAPFREVLNSPRALSGNSCVRIALLSLTLLYTHFVLIHSSVNTNMQMDETVKDLLDIYMG